jgi:segregation and condensation protein A
MSADATQRMKNKPELKIVVSNTPAAPTVEPPPEQVEMPFAIVNGEPITQMPKDLYIPPQAMEVFLEAFEGPLDLLLYLIRRQNLNILDIPLAEITRQYMKYIEVMTELQLELAGEYMVMAATLAEIKSRMLLPRPKPDQDGNEEDPRAELVRRLQEYERFKRAAESIDALHRLERDVWATSAELKDRKVVRLLPQVTLQEMLLAFKDVVVRSEMFAHHHIQRERLSVRARMGDILSTLEHSSFVEFIRLFRVEEGRMGITVTFVAILELVREGLIEIVQAEPFAPIHVRSAGANRKLHIVAGNEALIAAGSVTDEPVVVVVGEPVLPGAVVVVAGEAVLADAAVAVGGAAVLADGTVAAGGAGGAGGVVGEAAGAGAIGEAAWAGAPIVTTADAELAAMAKLDLDPDFVDDDDDDLEDGPLEGVDDVLHSPGAMVAKGPLNADDFGQAIQPSPTEETVMSVEPEKPVDDPLDEPPPLDVEYEGPTLAEVVASGEQSASDEPDEGISLIGDTSVTGKVSLVGDDSVSGGPVVEVEEFEFDELPDELSSPDEESDE